MKYWFALFIFIHPLQVCRQTNATLCNDKNGCWLAILNLQKDFQSSVLSLYYLLCAPNIKEKDSLVFSAHLFGEPFFQLPSWQSSVKSSLIYWLALSHLSIRILLSLPWCWFSLFTIVFVFCSWDLVACIPPPLARPHNTQQFTVSTDIVSLYIFSVLTECLPLRDRSITSWRMDFFFSLSLYQALFMWAPVPVICIFVEKGKNRMLKNRTKLYCHPLGPEGTKKGKMWLIQH